MFVEPEKRLARAAQSRDLVEDERDRLLHTPVRVLLQPVTHLHEADGRGHDKFATSSFLLACRERTLAQQIEFVLIETAVAVGNSRPDILVVQPTQYWYGQGLTEVWRRGGSARLLQ